MLQKELETAVRLARDAAKVILESYAREIIAEKKISADRSTEPVTAADRASSRIIVDGLRDEFPNDGILSEEEVDLPAERVGRSRVWIIDPIDGTWGFVKKDGDFAVQIGLAVGGRAALGVVLAPVSDTLYFAAGTGAFITVAQSEPVRLSVRDTTDFRKMVVATSRNHRNERIARVNRHFGFAGELQRGSVGIKVGLIAERQCDVYINLSGKSKFWDTCAPQAIIEQSGGVMTDLFGEEFDYGLADVQNYNGIVVAGAASHAAIVKKLRSVLSEIGRPKIKQSAAPKAY